MTSNSTGMFSAAVKQMMDYYETLVKDNTQAKELGFHQIIPLLSESYFTGEIGIEKLDEFLQPFDNGTLRGSIKSKLIQIKDQIVKNSQKMEEERRIEATQKQAKEADRLRLQKQQRQSKQPKQQKQLKQGKEGKERGKIFDRIESSNPKKRVKVDKQGMKDQKKENLEGQEEKEQGDKKEGLKRQLEREGKQKCRFFPFCKNEETCEYFHPTEKVKIIVDHKKEQIKFTPELNGNNQKTNDKNKNYQSIQSLKSQCKYFPNCKHGDSCLYVHEACRFSQNCTKPGCPYVHPFKKNNNFFEEMMKTYLQTQNHPFKSKKKGGKNQSQNPGFSQPQSQQQSKQEQN